MYAALRYNYSSDGTEEILTFHCPVNTKSSLICITLHYYQINFLQKSLLR